MEQFNLHISSFAALMKDKGYNGNFWIDPEQPARLTDILSRLLAAERNRTVLNEYIVATISTYTEWINWQCNYTACDFGIYYIKGKGFSVLDMRINHYTFDQVPLVSLYLKVAAAAVVPRRRRINRTIKNIILSNHTWRSVVKRWWRWWFAR